MMAYRVLSKSTYHNVWCVSLPMAAPCALFSRWTSRTLEGQKWCFETLTVAIIDSPTSRQSCHRRTLSLLVWLQHYGHQIWEEWRIWGEDVCKKKASYYITYHKFQHENTSKTAGTSHVPKSWASLLFKTILLTHVHDATFFQILYGSTLDPIYQVSNYYYWPDRSWSKNGNKGNPPLGSGLWLSPPSPSSAPSGKASSTAVLGTHAVRLRRKVRIRSMVPLPRLCSKASDMQCLGKGRPWCEDEGV